MSADMAMSLTDKGQRGYNSFDNEQDAGDEHSNINQDSKEDASHECCLNSPCGRPIAMIIICVSIALSIFLIYTIQGPSNPVTKNGESFPWNNGRLPTFIKPIKYKIELTPNLTSLSVEGHTNLIFNVSKATHFIVFHAKHMEIVNTAINGKLRVSRMLELPGRDQIYLETDSSMKPEITYTLSVKFKYKFSRILQGFYVSRYDDEDGQERRLAVTKFEPTYARWAFPCFDEPQLKAVFSVSMTHDKNLDAYFNTPRKAQSPVPDQPNQIQDQFEDTVNMSTYLVAFLLCDFKVKTAFTKINNISVSVIASEAKIGYAQFAVDTATKLIDQYEEFFGLNYPLAKMDMVAVPDFNAGGMENWGLITYREVYLLYNQDETETESMQHIAHVVAHELAHQWFGNLVTMEWWNDLWLNEGFATWMDYQGVNMVYPEWKILDQFYHDKVTRALSLDSLASSHPIMVSVDDPSEIESAFDPISYSKGAGVIGMMEAYLGLDTLKKGIHKYLDKHKFGNAVTNDLWNALSTTMKNTNIDVTAMMDTWILQMGYPVITLIKVSSSQYAMEQKHFLTTRYLNKSSVEVPYSKFNYTWIIPIDFKINIEGKTYKVLLTNGTSKIHDLGPGVTWIKANLDAKGFYRVNYPKEIWRELIKALKEDMNLFTALDRAQLIGDAFALCRAGLLDSDILLDLTLYLRDETDLVPWQMALNGFGLWKRILKESKVDPRINAYIRYLIRPVYGKLGDDPNKLWGDNPKKLLRSLILKEAVTAGEPKAVSAAEKMFRNFTENGNSIPADLQYMVYSAVVRQGNSTYWNYCFKQYQETNVPSKKKMLLRVLGKTADSVQLKKFLDMTKNESLIRTQDLSTVIYSVSKNNFGWSHAWRFLQMNWKMFYEKFSKGSFTMGSILKYVTEDFSTRLDYDQMKNFFSGLDVGSGKRSVQQILETIETNIMFREDNEENILKWFNKKKIN